MTGNGNAEDGVRHTFDQLFPNHACRRRVLGFLEHHAHQLRASNLDPLLYA